MGIKTYDDELNMRLIGYEALFDPKPTLDSDRNQVELTDRALSELTAEQAELVMKTCSAFDIEFGNTLNVITYLKNIREGKHDYE
jgi:hypothetical protein